MSKDFLIIGIIFLLMYLLGYCILRALDLLVKICCNLGL